jgi:hypothetical protein
MIREIIAALGVAFYAAMGTWAAVWVRWFPSEYRWFVVSFGLFLFGQALRRLWISHHLKRLRCRLGLSQSRVFRLQMAVQTLAGAPAMVGALILLAKADTPERRVLGILAVVGALFWLLSWGWILRGVWNVNDQLDVTDAR